MSKDIKKTNWSKKEDKKLGKMISEGMTYKVISKKLNRSASAVATRVATLRKSGVVIDGKNGGRPLKAPKQEKPSSVKVAEKVLKNQKKAKKRYKVVTKTLQPKPFELSDAISNGKKSLTDITRLVLYAEMLEKQNAALKKRLVDVEKALRD